MLEKRCTNESIGGLTCQVFDLTGLNHSQIKSFTSGKPWKKACGRIAIVGKISDKEEAENLPRELLMEVALDLVFNMGEVSEVMLAVKSGYEVVLSNYGNKGIVYSTTGERQLAIA